MHEKFSQCSHILQLRFEAGTYEYNVATMPALSVVWWRTLISLLKILVDNWAFVRKWRLEDQTTSKHISTCH